VRLLSHGQPASYRFVRRISTAKRYDSIGSALADRVRVGSVVIPGHFRLGRLSQAAGGCGGRGLSMGVEGSFCFEWDLIGYRQGSELCLAERRSLREQRFGVPRRGYRCLFFGFSHDEAPLVLSDDIGHLERWPVHRWCNFRESFTLSGLETLIVSKGLATAVKCFRERCR
jgi:hypothetical protein